MISLAKIDSNNVIQNDRDITKSCNIWVSTPRSWDRSRVGVTLSTQHLTDLLLFNFTSIRPLIPEIQSFQNLTQGQGHKCGQWSRSYSWLRVQQTRTPFILCQPALPFLTHTYLKTYLYFWKKSDGLNSESHSSFFVCIWSTTSKPAMNRQKAWWQQSNKLKNYNCFCPSVQASFTMFYQLPHIEQFHM